MVKRIKSLQELRRIPCWSVIFYKEDNIFKNPAHWHWYGDAYVVGIVIPRRLPDMIKSRLKDSFLDAVKRTYDSEVMEEIRGYGDAFGNRWDKEPGYVHVVTEFEPLNCDNIPKTKDLIIVIDTPVPEDHEMAEKFTLKLEEILNQSN